METKKEKLQMLAPQLVIVFWGLWSCRDLILLYSTKAPEYRCGVLAFFLWLIPILQALIFKIPKRLSMKTTPSFSILGLGCILISVISSLHVVGQIGLIFALAGLLHFQWKNWLWMLGALSWMPVLIWFSLRHGLDEQIVMIRLGILLFSFTGFYFCNMTDSKDFHENDET